MEMSSGLSKVIKINIINPGPIPDDMVKYIAFVCGHNAGRSQMAQAAFNTLKGLLENYFPKLKDYEAISWGTDVKEDCKLNSRSVASMKNIGIDMTNKNK